MRRRLARAPITEPISCLLDRITSTTNSSDSFSCSSLKLATWSSGDYKVIKKCSNCGNFQNKLFKSNLQLSLKSTSTGGCTFPCNNKTPIIHKEHLRRFPRWTAIKTVKRRRKSLRSPPSSSVYKSLLHNNIPVIWITFPFLELTRASPSHLSKLINLSSLFNTNKFTSSIFIHWKTKTIFKEGHLTCPAWLSCWAPVTSSWVKIHLEDNLSQMYLQTLIFALDQASAFFSVQCQLLTLVASGLSSTIHLNLKKDHFMIGQGRKPCTWDHPRPTWPFVNELSLQSCSENEGGKSFSRLLQNQHIWALGVWYTAKVSNLFSQSQTMTRGTSGWGKVLLLWCRFSFSHWSSRKVRLGGAALCLHGLLCGVEMSV